MKRLALFAFLLGGFSVLSAQSTLPNKPEVKQAKALEKTAPSLNPSQPNQEQNSPSKKDYNVTVTPIAVAPLPVRREEFLKASPEKQAFIQNNPDKYQLVD